MTYISPVRFWDVGQAVRYKGIDVPDTDYLELASGIDRKSNLFYRIATNLGMRGENVCSGRLLQTAVRIRPDDPGGQSNSLGVSIITPNELSNGHILRPTSVVIDFNGVDTFSYPIEHLTDELPLDIYELVGSSLPEAHMGNENLERFTFTDFECDAYELAARKAASFANGNL